jgi:hypothetical protein
MTNGNSAERELFEEYMKKEHPMMPLDRHTDKDSIKFDEYRVNWIEDMWESWQARAALSVCADGGKDSSDQKFKNFHRLLCERFGYTHDEVDWKRDQLSLIEWIAKQAKGGKSEAVGWAIKEKGFDHLVFDHETGEKPSALDMEWAMERGHQYIPLYADRPADGGKGEAQNVMNIPLDAAAAMADYAPQAECAPREAQSDQQKQDDLTEVESLAKCEPEEDGSLSVNELFAMQAENAAPTPKLYAHPIASADELIDGGSSK